MSTYRTLLAACGLALCPGPRPAAEAADWLEADAVPIRSVDPFDEDFEDLEPLREKIGDARIVQLGEPSHGDGLAFLAKCRLVKFLHQEMGFEVLVWESGLYDCARLNQALAEGEDPAAVAPRGVFSIWSSSEQCRPVFEYAGESWELDAPLEMAGMDCQLTGTAAQDLGGDLAEFLDGLGEETFDPASRQVLDASIESFLDPSDPGQSVPLEELRAAVETLVRDLDTAEAGDPRELAFFRRCLTNYADLAEFVQLFVDPKPRSQLEASNFRDRVMGENLVWLADEYYPGKKLIVWAAGRHVAHDLEAVDATLPSPPYRGFVCQGDVAHRRLGDQLYTILFTAYSGAAGTVSSPPRDLPESSEGSLEQRLHETGTPYWFVDLRGGREDDAHWMRRPYAARPFGYLEQRADWSRVADAFFFTDSMEPSRLVE
jgi:erythromycin esterase